MLASDRADAEWPEARRVYRWCGKASVCSPALHLPTQALLTAAPRAERPQPVTETGKPRHREVTKSTRWEGLEPQQSRPESTLLDHLKKGSVNYDFPFSFL